MLRSLVSRIVCPSCRDATASVTLISEADAPDGHVRDGRLTCEACRAEFPIRNELLELVPAPLIDGCAATTPEFVDQIEQRRHFDEFAQGLRPDYTKSSSIQASTRRYINLGRSRFRGPGSWMLDVGCGNGAGSFPYAGEHKVIAFDISKEVIRQDIEEARRRGCAASTTFFVGDGSFLAFKDASFDHVQTFGALHHMPDPAETIRQAYRILKPGGTYFAVENNKSALRWIFDLMMRLRPLWIEKAGAEPLISHQMVADWCRELPVTLNIETSFFLPPHLLNLLPQRAADGLMEWSDVVLSRLPWIGKQGGQIVLTMTKSAA